MKNHDAGWREDDAAELAHREHEDRVNSATECDACEAPLGVERYADEENGRVYVICPTCARHLAGLALDNMMSKRAVARYTETMAEPSKGRWA
jgi:hypothetical protein